MAGELAAQSAYHVGMWKLAMGAFVVVALTSGPRATLSLDSPDPEPLEQRCGNYACEPPETCQTCPSDCGDCCGNSHCEYPETCRSCPQDCGDCCGNYRCEPPEDCNSCPQDCGNCNSR